MIKPKRSFGGDSRSGSVVVVALIMIAVAVISAASAARFCLHEWGLSEHSAARIQSLHTSEAGAEAAMYAFSRQQTSGDGWAGWTLVSNGVYAVERAMEGMPVSASAASSFRVMANTNTLTIVSSGAAAVPRLDAPSVRTIEVILESRDIPFRSPFEWGMVAKDQLRVVGNPLCLSYDSRNGPFGGANVMSNCNIGATGFRADAITGGGAAQVFGDAAVAVGAGVDVNPGAFWSGALRQDLEVDFEDVVSPRTDMTRAAINNANTTLNVAGNTYVGVPSIGLVNKTLTIQGNGELTLYVSGEMSVNTAAEIVYTPSAGGNVLVRLFLNGNANIKGKLNTGGLPINLQMYGTPNCQAIDCQANNDRSMVIYAPQADIDFGGNAVIQGSIVGMNIRQHGNPAFRYDEALSDLDLPTGGQRPQEYVMKSWMEIWPE